MAEPIIPKSPSRKDYTEDETYQKQAEGNAEPIFERDDPLALFTAWMSEAREAEPNDANAMALATVDETGLPDVRMVLLKGVDERGFVFYTNDQSTKGQQLIDSGKAALCLHWKSLRRQVRVRGPVTHVSPDEADAYFASRARLSQIGAWASDQSRELDSRETFKARLAEIEAKYEGQDVPRPPHWNGWRVAPEQIEFWRDRPYRLHDRLVFTRTENGWSKKRLYP